MKSKRISCGIWQSHGKNGKKSLQGIFNKLSKTVVYHSHFLLSIISAVGWMVECTVFPPLFMCVCVCVLPLFFLLSFSLLRACSLMSHSARYSCAAFRAQNHCSHSFVSAAFILFLFICMHRISN